MKLYEAVTVAIILGILFAYIAGVTNWSYHCKPGGLDPPGCPKQATQTKEAK